ncbi:MAG: hypothetical protein K2X81_13105 [Candidatus Obscuribacterales bacterium]|nr:hypothetical protein [Candidatus Obscuribacterales bacterium]
MPDELISTEAQDMPSVPLSKEDLSNALCLAEANLKAIETSCGAESIIVAECLRYITQLLDSGGIEPDKSSQIKARSQAIFGNYAEKMKLVEPFALTAKKQVLDNPLQSFGPIETPLREALKVGLSTSHRCDPVLQDLIYSMEIALREQGKDMDAKYLQSDPVQFITGDHAPGWYLEQQQPNPQKSDPKPLIPFMILAILLIAGLVFCLQFLKPAMQMPAESERKDSKNTEVRETVVPMDEPPKLAKPPLMNEKTKKRNKHHSKKSK